MRDNLEEQLATRENEVIELSGQLAEKEEKLNIKILLIEEHEEKIELLSRELRNCLEAWISPSNPTPEPNRSPGPELKALR